MTYLLDDTGQIREPCNPRCGCDVPLVSGVCPRCRLAERLVFTGIAVVVAIPVLVMPMMVGLGWL